MPSHLSRRNSLALLAASAWLGLLLASPNPRPAAGQPFGPAQRLELSADVQLEEADHTARSHLERIERFLQDRQWEEAIEALRRLTENDAGRLLRLGTEPAEKEHFSRYVPLRTACQIKLALLHRAAPEALQLYRSRVDPLVERWYEQGLGQGQEQLLRQIVERFLVSRAGDKALYRLGDLALERGEFVRARSAWERIDPRTRILPLTPPAGTASVPLPLGLVLQGLDLNAQWDEVKPRLGEGPLSPNWLCHPDSQLEFAAVLARLTLTSILEGSTARAQVELAVLRRLRPEAEGTLGGRRGKYVELLQDLLTQSSAWPAASVSPDWPTLGGDMSRDKAAAAGVDIALRPLWQQTLPKLGGEDALLVGTPRAGEQRTACLSYHPLVVDGVVLLATGDRVEDVQAWDLRTGRSLWPGAAPGPAPAAPAVVGAEGRGPVAPFGVPRYTMTASGRRLFVRLGPQFTPAPQEGRAELFAAGYLAALDLDAEKKRLFEIRPDSEAWGPGWMFEGPPVTDADNLYVALRRRDNLRAQAHVACMDKKHGKLRWRRFVAAAETPGQGRTPEYTHNLLTLAEGRLYFNTNLGAVAALRAEDGEIEWLVRYPRAPFDDGNPDRSRRHWYRDLNPCLIHQGLVFVAPVDCDRVFALEAATGAVVWATLPQQAVDAVHLLGVGQDRLLVSGDRLYWLNARDGEVVTCFPARVEDPLRGAGRGLLAGQEVYWPTRERIYVFSQDGSRQTRQPLEIAPLGLTGGNLVISDGVLLLATAEQLVAFDAHGPQSATSAAGPK